MATRSVERARPGKLRNRSVISFARAALVYDVQTDEASDERDKIKLPQNCFEQGGRAGRGACRNDIAVTHRCEGDETKIAQLHHATDQIVRHRGTRKGK